MIGIGQILLGLLKLLAPVLLFFKGKADARREIETETVKEELKDAKEAAKSEAGARDMSDDELVASVYKHPHKGK